MARVEGKTIKQIVEYFRNPLVTREYVIQVLESSRYLKAKPKNVAFVKKLKNGPPKEGTKSREVYDLVLSKGGPEAFMKLLETTSMFQLARDWGLEPIRLILYKRDFVTGRSRNPQILSVLAPVRKKQKRIEKVSKIRKLW